MKTPSQIRKLKDSVEIDQAAIEIEQAWQSGVLTPTQYCSLQDALSEAKS